MRAVMPLDPQGRGTWIAANGAGLVFALLNSPSGPSDAGRVSRGLVIPALLECDTVHRVVDRIERLVVRDFKPFRLVVAADDTVVEFVPDGSTLQPVAHDLSHPLLFTSSSLGDALVDGPRRMLFEQMLGMPWDLVAHQDVYHRHRWRDRPAVSVHMSRPDACTVSITTVEVGRSDVRMFYEPAHAEEGVSVGLSIDRINATRTESDSLYASAVAS